MAEPTELPIFDENDTNTDVIPDTLKDDGFGLKQKAPSTIFNTWFRNVYKWIEWFKEKFLLIDADIERLQPVESIAALRALDITDYSNGATINVTGYYAKGDGGGGPIRYLDTGQIPIFYTDNGGSIVVPDGGDGSAAWLWDYSGAIYGEWFGAIADWNGVTGTDNSTIVNVLLALFGHVRLAEGSFLFESDIETVSGQWLQGAGKDSTYLIGDFSNGSILSMDNNIHSTVSDMTIQSQDVTTICASITQSGTGQSVSNTLRNIRFIGNSAGARPLFGDSGAIGIYGNESQSGYANYFNRIENCDFDSLHTAISAEYNANAWFVSNVKFQNIWKGFLGGFQEWVADKIWWHSSSGDITNDVVLFDINGDASHSAQYNQFFNFFGEPGSNTIIFQLGAFTLANYFLGDCQVTEGTDVGNGNVRDRNLIGKTRYSDAWHIVSEALKIADVNTDVDDEYVVDFFGDGSNAQTGIGVQSVRLWGRDGATRNMLLQMGVANAKIGTQVAGDTEIISAGTIAAKVSSTVGSGETGLYVLYDATAGVTIGQVTVGAADSAGVGFRELKVPN